MTAGHFMAKAPRPCKVPGCPEHASNVGAYCPDHTRDKERRKRRGTSAAYNTAAWRRIRAAFIAKHGDQCWACSKPATQRDPATVHHIDGNPRNNREANLAVLHRTCHGRLEREVDADRIGPVRRALQRTIDARDRRNA